MCVGSGREKEGEGERWEQAVQETIITISMFGMIRMTVPFTGPSSVADERQEERDGFGGGEGGQVSSGHRRQTVAKQNLRIRGQDQTMRGRNKGKMSSPWRECRGSPFHSLTVQPAATLLFNSMNIPFNCMS